MEFLLLLSLPIITGLLCWLVKQVMWKNLINGFGSFGTFVIGLYLTHRVFTHETVTSWSNSFYLDALGAYLLILVVLVSLLAALYSIGYMKIELEHGLITEKKLGTYYLYYHLFIFTMLAVLIVNNLGIMWVAIEATTLVSALLVAYYNQETSLEAAWKYIILCTVGITFALFGTILAYYAASKNLGEADNILNWTVLMANAHKLDPNIIKLSFLFILIGYGTKAGFAPMHTWLPDAHSQAPSPVSAVLSGVLLNCAIYGIIRFHTITSATIGSAFSSNLLIIFGLLSMGIAVPFIIIQHDIKRLLAYSTLEHMGIIAAGLGIGSSGLGTGAKLGLFGAVLHLLNHAIAKSMLFFSAGRISQHYQTKNTLRIHGAIKSMPITGVIFLLGTFAITGTPPFNVFISEFSIFSGGFHQGKYLTSILFIIFVTVIFAGMLYHVARMAFGQKPLKITQERESWLLTVTMIIPVIIVIVLGIYIPQPLNTFIEEVAQIIMGGD